MHANSVRAEADKRLFQTIMADRMVQQVLQQMQEQGEQLGTRRSLLAQALRLTPAVAPNLHKTLRHCVERLDVQMDVEVFVYPSANYNAACTPPEGGRVFVLLSSSLLQSFESAELTFVLGHELGHHVYEHHKVPLGPLLSGQLGVKPQLVLQVLAWQRQAEISADRAGMLCCGEFTAAARGFFKLSSGMVDAPGPEQIKAFVEQAEELYRESEAMGSADSRHQTDWMSSHPFSPIRLRAAEIFSRSVAFEGGTVELGEVELQVAELMGLMEASYLEEDSEEAEVMRRALFTAALLLADVSRGVSSQELEALRDLLGPGSVPAQVDIDRLRPLLDDRLQAVKAKVRPTRRVQLLRDLATIARADSPIHKKERAMMVQIAATIEVDSLLLDRVLAAPTELD